MDETATVHQRENSQRRRRVLTLLLSTITMVLVGLAIAFMAVIYNATPSASIPTKQLEGFTLDDVLSGKFYAESFNGTWISGISLVCQPDKPVSLKCEKHFANIMQVTNLVTGLQTVASTFTT